MMYLRKELNIGYIGDLKTQILELPYAGDVSMFLLLPDEIGDVSTGLELVSHSSLHCLKPLDLNSSFTTNMYTGVESGVQLLTETWELVDNKCLGLKLSFRAWKYVIHAIFLQIFYQCITFLYHPQYGKLKVIDC